MPAPSSMGPRPPLHHSLPSQQHHYGQHAAPPGLQSYALASGMDFSGTPYPGGPGSAEVLETQASDAEMELGQQALAGSIRNNDSALPEQLPRKRNRQ